MTELFNGNPPPLALQYLGGPVGPYCIAKTNGQYVLEPSTEGSARIYFIRTAKAGAAV